MPWVWKINNHCYFCQNEYWGDSPPEFDIHEKLTPCGTCLVDINGKLTAVLICKECYDKKNKKVKCPECHGEGVWHEGGPYLPPGGMDEICDLCDGTGEVSQKLRMEWVRNFKELTPEVRELYKKRREQ